MLIEFSRWHFQSDFHFAIYKPNAFNVYTRRIWMLLAAGIPKLWSFCEFDILFVFAIVFYTFGVATRSLVWSSLGNFYLNLRQVLNQFCLCFFVYTSNMTSALQDINHMRSICRLDGFERVLPRAFQNSWIFVNWIFRVCGPLFSPLSASPQGVWFDQA